MKMAKASERDLECAIEVSNMLEELLKSYMCAPKRKEGDPAESEDIEHFDRDDAAQCKRALNMLLNEAAKGSMFRVTFGMLVVCDPRNELLDPDDDTIQKHPKTRAALALQAALEELLATWEARARDALPADAMLVNKHVRELREAMDPKVGEAITG